VAAALALTSSPASADELLGDGGFENGSVVAGRYVNSPNWIEADNIFESPICFSACTADGTRAPRSGSKWAWFGGVSDFYHVASVRQTLVIPAGMPVIASWWRWVAPGGDGDETLTVYLDGVPLATYTPSDGGDGYVHDSFDISASADGGNHTLWIDYVSPPGGTAVSMNVDDVSIFRYPPPAAPTGLTVSPASGSDDDHPSIKGSVDAVTTTVRLYTDDTCSMPIGPAADIATFTGDGISIGVANRSSNDFWAKATGPGGTSDCSTSTVHYDEFSPPAPTAPTGLSVTPASGSNANNPLVSGSADANTTDVQLYTDDACAADIGPLSSVGTFTTGGIQVGVADNSSTDFYAKATGPGGDSPCSTDAVHYSEITPAPVAPTSLAVAPASGSDDTHPVISGTTGIDTDTVQLYTDSGCTTPIGSPNIAGTFNTTGIQVTVAYNSSTDFYANATGPGGESNCSTDTVEYKELTAPLAPIHLTVTPSSGSNENDPKVKGTADINTTTVQLYTDDTCSKPIGPAASVETFIGGVDFSGEGVPIRVADNSSTDFYAKATGPGGGSPCSTDTVHYSEITPAMPPAANGGAGATPGAAVAKRCTTRSLRKKGQKLKARKCVKRKKRK
jgi:hypothetical protein